MCKRLPNWCFTSGVRREESSAWRPLKWTRTLYANRASVHCICGFPNKGNKCISQQIVSFCELMLLESCKPSCEGIVVFSDVVFAVGFKGKSSLTCTRALFPWTFPAELWSFQAAVDALSPTCLGCAGAAVVAYLLHVGGGGQRASENTQPVLLPPASQSAGQSQGLSVTPSHGSTAGFGSHLSCCTTALQSLVMS